MHDQAAQAVAKGHDNDLPACPELGNYPGLPVGQDAFDGVSQRFCQRQLFFGQTCINPVMAGPARIFFCQGRRSSAVAAPPDLDLVSPMPGCCLCLVQALQGAIVALIELPGLFNRQPELVQLIQDIVEGTDRSF